MLPQKNRLQNTKEIERVFRGGKGLKGDFFSLKFLKNGLAVSRFAFVVSRKVAKKAVRRNKIKRILRAIIQKKMPGMKTGLDLVITAQKGAETKGFFEIKKDIGTLFGRVKLWD